MIEELPAGAVLREDGRLTLNRAAEAITGYARRELATLEAWCTALHGEEARERQSQYETNLSLEQGAQRFSLALTRKDGTSY